MRRFDLPAKNVNDDARILNGRGAYRFFASKLRSYRDFGGS